MVRSYSLTHSLTYLLTYLLTHSYLLTHLLTHSLTYSLTYLLTHSLTHSLTPSLTHLLTHSLTLLCRYFNHVVTSIFAGILPFAAVSVELFFIMSALWLHQIYFIFGFLFLVMIVLVVTCGEISILLCYFHLCNEVSLLTHLLTHSLTHLLTSSLTHSLTGLQMVVEIILIWRFMRWLYVGLLNMV
jgi:hypothetical protein